MIQGVFFSWIFNTGHIEEKLRIAVNDYSFASVITVDMEGSDLMARILVVFAENLQGVIRFKIFMKEGRL